MKPLGEVTLNDNRERQEPHFLKFQVVEGNSKPLLSAETCENLGLLQINCASTPQVNSLSEVKPLLIKDKILQDYKDVFEGLGNNYRKSEFYSRPGSHASASRTPTHCSHATQRS